MIEKASKAVARALQDLTRRDFILLYSTDTQHCVGFLRGREANHRVPRASCLRIMKLAG
jgi:hypothetical protein